MNNFIEPNRTNGSYPALFFVELEQFFQKKYIRFVSNVKIFRKFIKTLDKRIIMQYNTYNTGNDPSVRRRFFLGFFSGKTIYLFYGGKLP